MLFEEGVSIQSVEGDGGTSTEHDGACDVVDACALLSLLVITYLSQEVERGEIITSTGFPVVTIRTSLRRLRSQRRTWPSEEAESSVLKEREVARVVTVDLWPKRQALGVKSTDLGPVTTAQTLMVQSTPAVIRVRESAKIVVESWPWCICSDRPTSCTC